MVLNNPVTEQTLPQTITRDSEFIAADKAHVDALHPHPQYLRVLDSYNSGNIVPISFTTNTWQSIGPDKTFGSQGEGSTWIFQVYMQYVETDGSAFNYYQYCASATIGAIFWQADLLSNEGIQVPVESHNTADFLCRLRLERGQARKIGLSFNRAISIVSPGFLQVWGIKVGFPMS